MAATAPSTLGVQQRTLGAVRRAFLLDAGYEVDSDGDVLAVTHRPTGEEFLVEVKVLPMGRHDG